MNNNMSMLACKYCDLIHDTDYNAEHEDECNLNPEVQEEIMEENTTLEEKLEKLS